MPVLASALLALSCSIEPEMEPLSLYFSVQCATECGQASLDRAVQCNGPKECTLRVREIPDFAPTRSSVRRQVHDSIGIFGYPFICSDALFVRTRDRWCSSQKYLKLEDSSPSQAKYYMYSPYSAPGLEALPGVESLSFRYRVPSSAASQPDIMAGESRAVDYGCTGVQLDCRHILAAVNFACGEDCPDSRLLSITLRGVWGEAEYSVDDGWRSFSEPSQYRLEPDCNVASGVSVPVTTGDQTLLLIPQTLPSAAEVEIRFLAEGSEYEVCAPLSGMVWEPGKTYVYTLHYSAEHFDSSVTYTIDMRSHRLQAAITDGMNCDLPAMAFDKGTRLVRVDWGDGCVEDFTASVTKVAHNYAKGFYGDATVLIRGTSPRFYNDYFRVYATDIKVDGNERYDSRENCNCLIETATNSIVLAGVHYKIPGSVTTIKSYALRGIETRSLAIPSNITTIESCAFTGPNAYLRDVIIPASVTSIGERYSNPGAEGEVTSNTSLPAAYDSDLTSIKVAAGNPRYDSRNNCNCIVETATDILLDGLTTSAIPSDIKAIGNYAFYSQSPNPVSLPDCCTSVGRCAFMYSYYLKTVSLAPGTVIGASAFKGCSQLSSLTFRGPGIMLGDESFCNCNSLREADLNAVGKYGSKSFCQCGFVSLTIPDGASIGDACFRSCPDLYEVRIGRNCRMFQFAFESCKALARIYSSSSIGSVTNASYYLNGIFTNCTALGELHVLPGCDEIGDCFNNSPLKDIYVHTPALPTISFQTFESVSPEGTIHLLKGSLRPYWMSDKPFNGGWRWTDDITN